MRLHDRGLFVQIVPDRNATEAQALIAEALSHLEKGEGTNVIFKNHDAYVGVLPALYKIVRTSQELSSKQRARLISNALLSMCRQGKSTKDEFVSLLRSDQNSILSLPRKQYHILGSIGGFNSPRTSSDPYLDASIGDTNVRITHSFPPEADTSH